MSCCHPLRVEAAGAAHPTLHTAAHVTDNCLAPVSGVPRLEDLVSGPDGCVPPKSMCPTPTSQRGGIWQWGLWEVVRVR